MGIARRLLGIAHLGLGSSAATASIANVIDPSFRIGSFPPGVVGAVGIGLALVGVAWLMPSMARSGVVRVVGALFGLLFGAVGLWGSSVVLSDFCSDRSPTAFIGSPASSIPAGVECWEVLPSLLIGWWMIAVGLLSILALLLEVRFAGRFEPDPALD